MRDALVSMGAAVLVTAALVGASTTVQHEPTSWEACGLTWTQALADPQARAAC